MIKFKGEGKLKKTDIIAIAVILVAVLLEIFLYFGKMPYYDEFCADPYAKTEGDSGKYLIDGSGTLQFRFKECPVENISLSLTAKDKNAINVNPITLKISGYSSSVGQRLLYRTETLAIGSHRDESYAIKVEIPRAEDEIVLEFSGADIEFFVSDVKFNSKDNIHFNFSRLIVIALITLTVWAFARFSLLKKTFDPQNKKHGIACLALVIVCAMFALLLSSLLCADKKNVSYPFEYDVKAYNPYEQQFDAFMKGQLHIDTEPSKELLEVKNPYDPSNRSGAEYLWDRAFYDGKYYSYFGIAPVLTVYFPYYFLTGSLPSEDMTVSILSLLTAVFFSMAALKFASMFSKKISWRVLSIGVFSGLMSSSMFLFMRGMARFYYIATLSAMMFMSLFIWLILCGASGYMPVSERENHKAKYGFKILYYVLAGIAFGLMFLSRFNVAVLMAFAVVPFLWFCVIREKREHIEENLAKFRKGKKIISELLALGCPVAFFLALQFVLNYLRFDSIFEFGTSYQLTISNVMLNRLRISDLPYALYHYFVQPLKFSPIFPFVNLSLENFLNYSHFVYIDYGMGLFSMPFMLFLIVGFFKLKDKKIAKSHKVIFVSLCAGLILTALSDFCIGGYIFRYVGDMSLIASFMSMAVMFACCEEDSLSDVDLSDIDGKTLKTGGIKTSLCIFVCILSLCLGISMTFMINKHLTGYNPAIFAYLRNLFDFFS